MTRHPTVDGQPEGRQEGEAQGRNLPSAGSATGVTEPALTPRHHIPESVLRMYVDGGVDHAAALAVACHLTLCGWCQEQMRSLDALAGATFGLQAPAGLSASLAAGLADGALASVMARLDQPDLSRSRRGATADGTVAPGSGAASSPPRVPDFLAACGLPRPLLRALPPGEPVRWRFLAPGVQFIDLTEPGPFGGGTARLVKLRRGIEIPLHDHQGEEYTVIFTGALGEDGARFCRGDVAYRKPGERHVQRVDPREDCVALQVNEGPLKPLTWKGKLLTLIAAVRS